MPDEGLLLEKDDFNIHWDQLPKGNAMKLQPIGF